MRRWICSFGLPTSGDATTSGAGVAWNKDASYQGLGQEGTPYGLTGSGFAFRRGAGAGTNYVQQSMQQGGASPTATTVSGLESFKIRLRRAPTVREELYALTNTSGGNFFMLTLDPNGLIEAWNCGGSFPGTRLYVGCNLVVGRWYQIVLMYVAAGGGAGGIPPTTLSCQLAVFDVSTGLPVFSGAGGSFTSIPLAAFTASLIGAEGRVATNNGLEFDIADWIMDDLGNTNPYAGGSTAIADAAFNTTMRVEVRRPIGPGSYNGWVTGGITAFDARCGIPPDSTGGGGVNLLTSNVANSKVTYNFGSLATMGLSGKGGVRAIRPSIYYAVGSGTQQIILRINGVDHFFPITAASNSWQTIVLDTHDTTVFPVNFGLLPSDTIEIGVQKDNTGNSSSIQSVLLELEVEIDPITPEIFVNDDIIRVAWGQYNGNSTSQSIATGFAPHWVSILPVSGASSDGALWCDWDVGAPGHADTRSIGTRFARLFGNGFSVAGSDVFCNQTGSTYQWVAVRDPNNRCLLRGGFSHTQQDSQVVNNFIDPTWTPLALWVKLLKWSSSLAAGSGYYKGPGHVGVDSSPLAGATITNGIISMAPGQFTSGIAVHMPTSDAQGATYTAWRTDRFVGGKKWNAITYTGDGTGARSISIDLDNRSPVWAMVLPHTAGGGWIRTAGLPVNHSYAISGTSLGDSTTGITDGANNIVKVASGANTNGVVYELFAIAGLPTGGAGTWTVPPGPGQPPAGWTDGPPMMPAPAGGSGCIANMSIPASSGGSGCIVPGV